MFNLTKNQTQRIQRFNAGELSVTNFVRLFLEEGISVEEMCPTPTDAAEMMEAYRETEFVSIPRISGANYGSHAALQVIVLRRRARAPRKSVYATCIVEIKGGR